MHPMTPEEARTAHLQRLRDLADCRRNHDDISAENAVRNLIAGTPAYWCMANSPTSLPAYATQLANSGQSLLSAMQRMEPDTMARRIDIATAIYDQIIPLNDAAVAELELCYRMQSTFRDDIRQREERAIMEPWHPERQSDNSRAFWSDLHDKAQQRFQERKRDAHWCKPVERVGLEVAV